jgi:hypothetical protein
VIQQVFRKVVPKEEAKMMKQSAALLLVIRFINEWRLNYEGKVFQVKNANT